MPEEATDLVEYFERTYIGSYKRVIIIIIYLFANKQLIHLTI